MASMTDSAAESILTTTTGLLTYYGYEAESQAEESLLDRWFGDYSPEWVRLALIESLYRGRYKTISVGGLLADWKRKGQPLYHFNREFEALICHKFPQIKFKQEDIPAAKRADSKSLELNRRHLQPQSTISTAEVVLKQQSPSSPIELNSQRFDSKSDSSLESETTPISHKLWSFVADLSDDKTSAQEHSHPSAPENGLNAPSRESVWDQESQKTEASPIDQFVPNREVSDHYQKLVELVVNRSTLHH